MNPWQLLHFPSGASVKKVLREIRQSTRPDHLVCADHGVALTLDDARIFLRDVERLEIQQIIAESDNWQNLIPKAGLGTWVMGAPGNSVQQTVAFLASLKVKSGSAKVIMSDFLGGKQAPCARATRSMVKSFEQDSSPFLDEASRLYAELQVSEKKWKDVIEYWRRIGASVAFDRGIPKTITPKDLVVAITPKSRTVSQLAGIIHQTPCLISDNTATSMIEATSRAHLGVERMEPAKSNTIRRGLLSGIGQLVEQRRLGTPEGAILIRRECVFTDQARSDFSDEAIPLHERLLDLVGAVPSWSSSAERLVDDGRVPAAHVDRLLLESSRWDSFSCRAAGLEKAPRQKAQVSMNNF